MRTSVILLFLLPLCAFLYSGLDAAPSSEALQELMRKTRPCFSRMGLVRDGDWLSRHKESGQTFVEYLNEDPTLPSPVRNVLYIQPLGTFSEPEQQVADLTAEFIGLFFGLPVRTREGIARSAIPDTECRINSFTHQPQIRSGYVLKEILKPRLPEDAAACLALTTSDLWPGAGWNFVFGEASLAGRVGVWSLARYGNPLGTPEEFRRYLIRTLKTASHETCHMFGMRHCTAYSCLMNGSNSLAESDGRPLELCPECIAKLCYATGFDPVDRYRKLAAFCKAQNLRRDLDLYLRLLQVTEVK